MSASIRNMHLPKYLIFVGAYFLWAKLSIKYKYRD